MLQSPNPSFGKEEILTCSIFYVSIAMFSKSDWNAELQFSIFPHTIKVRYVFVYSHWVSFEPLLLSTFHCRLWAGFFGAMFLLWFREAHLLPVSQFQFWYGNSFSKPNLSRELRLVIRKRNASLRFCFIACRQSNGVIRAWCSCNGGTNWYFIWKPRPAR